jgi:hypothetical protein
MTGVTPQFRIGNESAEPPETLQTLGFYPRILTNRSVTGQVWRRQEQLPTNSPVAVRRHR